MPGNEPRALPETLVAIAESLGLKLDLPTVPSGKTASFVNVSDAAGVCPLCVHERESNRGEWSYPIAELPKGGSSIRLHDLHYVCSNASCPACRVPLEPSTWVSVLSGGQGLWEMYREAWEQRVKTNGVVVRMDGSPVELVPDLDGNLVPAVSTTTAELPPERRQTEERLRNPKRDAFILGKMIPFGKASVLYGPTSGGKSVFLSELAYAFAAGKESIWGLSLPAGGGDVLIYTAEDTTDDWDCKGAAFCRAGLIDPATAWQRVWIIDKTEGEARLTEKVTLRESAEVTRHVVRPTAERDRIIAAAIRCNAKLVIVETASRLVEDEDNPSMSALLSALGHIARATGAAVVVSHHATKKAIEDNDASLNAARGGSAFVSNARNALSLFPADEEVTRAMPDFDPKAVLVLRHGKSTSSTRRQDDVILVMCDPGGELGGVLQLPEDAVVTPEMHVQGQQRRVEQAEKEAHQLRVLYAMAVELHETGPITKNKLEASAKKSGMKIRDIRRLIKKASNEKIFLNGELVRGGGREIILGWDPRGGCRGSDEAEDLE